MGMDLARFMERVDATLQDVADATGLDISTISRIRSCRTKNPRTKAVSAIQRWADREAQRLRLRVPERLDLSGSYAPTPSSVTDAPADEQGRGAA